MDSQKQQKEGDILTENRSKKKPNNPLILQKIKPQTINQNKIVEAFETNKHLFIHGYAGTGKTYLALYLAIDEILNYDTEYNELIIIRSAVPSRDQGFMPGDLQEKEEIFELPYIHLVNKLFNNPTAYTNLKRQGVIRFLSTSYLRGLTLDNAIILADEVQNMNGQEIDTIITRIGKNSKIILCGDSNQNDLFFQHEDSCIDNLMKIMNYLPSFEIIEMESDDILRNDIVKEWIIAKKQVANTEPSFMKRYK